MKKLLLAGSFSLLAMTSFAGAPIVPADKMPQYIDPDSIPESGEFSIVVADQDTVAVIDAPSTPWSFDMVREPDILPIIPEFSQQVVNEVTITDYNIESDVLFDFDKFNVDVDNQIFLNRVADHILKTYQQIDRVIVEGHTDRLGSEAYNYDLSQKRANTIKDLLEIKGIEGALIEVFARGESQPVTDGCPTIQERAALKSCLKKDRRVEIRVEGKAQETDIYQGLEAQ